MGDSSLESLDTRVVTPESVEPRSPGLTLASVGLRHERCNVVTGKLSAGQIPETITSAINRDIQ